MTQGAGADARRVALTTSLCRTRKVTGVIKVAIFGEPAVNVAVRSSSVADGPFLVTVTTAPHAGVVVLIVRLLTRTLTRSDPSEKSLAVPPGLSVSSVVPPNGWDWYFQISRGKKTGIELVSDIPFARAVNVRST
jgi:hypothetical protein